MADHIKLEFLASWGDARLRLGPELVSPNETAGCELDADALREIARSVS